MKTTSGFNLPSRETPAETKTFLTHLELMRNILGERIKIAMDDVGSLEELLKMRALGIERASTRCTSIILEETRRDGIGEERDDFPLDWFNI